MNHHMNEEIDNHHIGGKEIIGHIDNLIKKLGYMMTKHDVNCTVLLEISALHYQMQFFRHTIDMWYPLEDTAKKFAINPHNQNIKSEIIDNFVKQSDFCLRKAFLALTQFNLETLLNVIIEKYKIEMKDNGGTLFDKYRKAIEYFEIVDNNYESLLRIYHMLRNTLHSGTRITKNFGPYTYRGQIFELKIGQEFVVFSSWRYFTFFTNEVLCIFEKIFESPKYKSRCVHSEK